jgi:hypothetical protein
MDPHQVNGILTGSLQIRLPSDATFPETAELAEDLSRSFAGTQVGKSNSGYASGSPGDLDAMWAVWLAVIWIGAGGFKAFAERLFQHLADDTHAGLHSLADRLSRALRSRRQEEAPVYWFFEVSGVATGEGEAPPRFVFRWAAGDDLREALEAAAAEIARVKVEPAEQAWRWNREAHAWEPYYRPTGGPS